MGRTPPALLAALLFCLAGPAAGQEDRSYPFQARDGYDEARYGSFETTITTADGPRPVRISVGKIRVEGGMRDVAIALPEAGLALLQHGAGGEVALTLDDREIAPREGQWLRIPLPAQLRIGTTDDSVLMDLIVVEE